MDGDALVVTAESMHLTLPRGVRSHFGKVVVVEVVVAAAVVVVAAAARPFPGTWTQRNAL